MHLIGLSLSAASQCSVLESYWQATILPNLGELEEGCCVFTDAFYVRTPVPHAFTVARDSLLLAARAEYPLVWEIWVSYI